jgi:enoyl-CoA hydratase/carnithine racemase
MFPGGGALERLPLLVGRARALEIILGSDDFDADTAAQYGWINRALPDDDLDAFVTHSHDGSPRSTSRTWPRRSDLSIEGLSLWPKTS